MKKKQKKQKKMKKWKKKANGKKNKNQVSTCSDGLRLDSVCCLGDWKLAAHMHVCLNQDESQ